MTPSPNASTPWIRFTSAEEGRGKREEGRGKREEGRGKREDRLAPRSGASRIFFSLKGAKRRSYLFQRRQPRSTSGTKRRSCLFQRRQPRSTSGAIFELRTRIRYNLSPFATHSIRERHVSQQRQGHRRHVRRCRLLRIRPVTARTGL
ncbi:hypothetical protein FZZ93_06210 [Halomonas eurihalina]|uniref:Uncharacterized protein n=1 Tax=Halomonas eurihalina TaxID=42566 RepID=A0A5D9D9R9_HALER|nr:hypothetical protein FZZ93_06210 [Halomonas eurihalina]